MKGEGATVICARCGNEARGFATIEGKRYCHTDEVFHDCFQQAQWARRGAINE